MTLMPILFTALFFVLGLIIGSFLNVVIFRLGTQKSFLESFGGRSACMSCLHQLSWYELIPVFSFLVLRGRCLVCRTKISMQYPLVELASGIIFLSLFIKFKDIFYADIVMFALIYAYFAFMFSILLVIAVYDLRHKIIPDALSLVFGILAFVGLFIFNDLAMQTGLYLHMPTTLELLAGPFLAFPFAFFWLISGGRWMGLGDAKLALGIGWLLPLPVALSGLVLAFWLGAVIGIILVILSRLGSTRLVKNSKISRLSFLWGMKSEIPFAPFLVFGAIMAFLFNFNFLGF